MSRHRGSPARPARPPRARTLRAFRRGGPHLGHRRLVAPARRRVDRAAPPRATREPVLLPRADPPVEELLLARRAGLVLGRARSGVARLAPARGGRRGRGLSALLPPRAARDREVARRARARSPARPAVR